MFAKTTLQEWESLVKKQLKTDDIYSILTKENLEGISVKPYYDSVDKALSALPRVEESTHLVSQYSSEMDENVFAVLAHDPVHGLSEKTIFYSAENILDDLIFEEGNTYFSLIDVFNDLGGHSATYQYGFSKESLEGIISKPFKRPVCIDISRHQNAGASIVQQLGIALAKTKELTEVFGKDILNKIIFKVAVGGQYFFEIAKIRALKILFNTYSKEFGLNEIPYLFTETSLRNKSQNNAENNLIRSTLEISAAMIGGADAVYAKDYQLSQPSDLTAEISFKQQIVLAYESIINVFDDAGNGSYYIEDLTQQLAQKAWQLFLEIEKEGGYNEMLNRSAIQKMIYAHGLEEQKWVQEGKIKLIGVNLYPKLEAKRTAEEMYTEKEIRPVRWAEMYE